jgi:hypothetical protein
LPVAVQKDGNVEALVDQPAVAELLIPPVAEVPALADDRDRQRTVVALVRNAGLVGAVSREVVADENGVDRGPRRLGDTLEYVREGRNRVVRDDEDADAQLSSFPPLPQTNGSHDSSTRGSEQAARPARRRTDLAGTGC